MGSGGDDGEAVPGGVLPESAADFFASGFVIEGLPRSGAPAWQKPKERPALRRSICSSLVRANSGALASCLSEWTLLFSYRAAYERPMAVTMEAASFALPSSALRPGAARPRRSEPRVHCCSPVLQAAPTSQRAQALSKAGRGRTPASQKRLEQ